MGCDVHDAKCPLSGIPSGIVKVIDEDARIGEELGVNRLVLSQVDTIEAAGIVALPPLTLAVCKCEVSVVWHTGLVARLVATE